MSHYKSNVRDIEFNLFETLGTDDVLKTGVCLLYTSDAADERSSVDLGGRRIIKKKKKTQCRTYQVVYEPIMKERTQTRET